LKFLYMITFVLRNCQFRLKFLYILRIHLPLRDYYSQIQFLFYSQLFTLHSPEVDCLNLFIAMGSFESLLIPTGPFSEKCITCLTERKMKSIEFKQHTSSAVSINYIVVLLSVVSIKEWKSKFQLLFSQIIFAIKHHYILKYLHGQLCRLQCTKLKENQCHFGTFSHVEFFRAEVTGKFKNTIRDF